MIMRIRSINESIQLYIGNISNNTTTNNNKVNTNNNANNNNSM